MQVFIVIHSIQYEGNDVHSVFANREDALERAQELNSSKRQVGKYIVETHTVHE